LVLDSANLLHDISQGDPLAIAQIEETLENGNLPDEDAEFVEALLEAATSDPTLIWDSPIGKGLQSIIDGDLKDVYKLLGDAGLEVVSPDGSKELWIFREGETGEGTPIEDIVTGGSYEGFSPFGRNYRSPDYIEPKWKRNRRKRRDKRNPGFDTGGYGSGTVLYQWRIGAWGVE
jgi:hypothetical protein